MATQDNPFRIDGQVAIVTGASRGLGAAMAKALATAGANLLLVARSDSSALQKQIEAVGRRCATLAVDVGDVTAAATIVDAAYAEFGRADVLVNNAGIIRRAPVLEFSEEDWSDVLRVNLDGAFRLSQRFAAEAVKRTRPGKIINIASMLSFQGGIRVVSYTAAKKCTGGLDPCYGQRTRGLAHQRQCDRAGLHGDRQHGGVARRRGAQCVHPCPHPRRTLGRIHRSGRRGGVSRLACLRLRSWHHSTGRWWLARALTLVAIFHR